MKLISILSILIVASLFSDFADAVVKKSRIPVRKRVSARSSATPPKKAPLRKPAGRKLVPLQNSKTPTSTLASTAALALPIASSSLAIKNTSPSGGLPSAPDANTPRPEDLKKETSLMSESAPAVKPDPIPTPPRPFRRSGFRLRQQLGNRQKRLRNENNRYGYNQVGYQDDDYDDTNQDKSTVQVDGRDQQIHDGPMTSGLLQNPIAAALAASAGTLAGVYLTQKLTPPPPMQSFPQSQIPMNPAMTGFNPVPANTANMPLMIPAGYAPQIAQAQTGALPQTNAVPLTQPKQNIHTDGFGPEIYDPSHSEQPMGEEYAGQPLDEDMPQDYSEEIAPKENTELYE